VTCEPGGEWLIADRTVVVGESSPTTYRPLWNTPYARLRLSVHSIAAGTNTGETSDGGDPYGWYKATYPD
jgi:hypothetical protein